jgi:hypothetical protein
MRVIFLLGSTSHHLSGVDASSDKKTITLSPLPVTVWRTWLALAAPAGEPQQDKLIV